MTIFFGGKRLPAASLSDRLGENRPVNAINLVCLISGLSGVSPGSEQKRGGSPHQTYAMGKTVAIKCAAYPDMQLVECIARTSNP